MIEPHWDRYVLQGTAGPLQDTELETLSIKHKTINVGLDFTRYPGGRYKDEGDFTGERFREEYLVPALHENNQVTVEMDGPLGYGAGFLEEAFGGLIRECGFTHDQLAHSLTVVASNDAILRQIKAFIFLARPKGKHWAIDRDFTGGMSSEDYVRAMRDGNCPPLR